MARRARWQLSRKQEECLRLLICGEKSQKEIAQEVGISESLLSRWKNRDTVFSSRYREALEEKKMSGMDEVQQEEYSAHKVCGAEEIQGMNEMCHEQEMSGAPGAGAIQGAHVAQLERSGALGTYKVCGAGEMQSVCEMPGAYEVCGAGEMQDMNEVCHGQEMFGVPGAAEGETGRKREYKAQTLPEKTAAQRYRDMEKAAADKLGQLLFCGDVKTEFQVAKEIIRLAQSAGEARGQEKADGMLESLLEGLEEV